MSDRLPVASPQRAFPRVRGRRIKMEKLNLQKQECLVPAAAAVSDVFAHRGMPGDAATRYTPAATHLSLLRIDSTPPSPRIAETITRVQLRSVFLIRFTEDGAARLISHLPSVSSPLPPLPPSTPVCCSSIHLSRVQCCNPGQYVPTSASPYDA